MVERVFSMSTGLDASTVTPGSTAPDASLTVPTIDACANAIVGTSTNPATIRKLFSNRYMVLLRGGMPDRSPDRWIFLVYQKQCRARNICLVKTKTFSI